MLSALLLGVVVGFVVEVLSRSTAGDPLLWNDTTIYQSLSHQPLLSAALWTSVKPPLTALMLKVFPTPQGFAWAQGVVYVVSCLTLVAVVCSFFARRWAQLVATTVLLGVASSTPMTLWNRSVLSDSLSVSLVLLGVAAGLVAVRSPTRCNLVLVVVALALNVENRYAQLASVAVVGGLLVAAGIATRRRSLYGSTLVVVGLCAVAVAGLGVLQESTSGLTASETSDIYLVRVFPFPGEVAWFAAHGMPDAQGINAAAGATTAMPGASKVVVVPDPALEHWVATEGSWTYLEWLAEHPSELVSQPLERPELAFNFANGDLEFYAPLGQSPSPLDPVVWPAWWWLVLLGVPGVVLVALRRLWRHPMVVVGVVLVPVGILQMGFAWFAAAQETTRHTLDGFVEVRLGVLLVVLLGLLHERAAPQGAASDRP